MSHTIIHDADNEELFPLRVACGKRFCNREKERKLLGDLILQKRPSVLISPRRYGKTSLAYKVTEELKYPFCVVDLFTAYDDDSICSAITQGVSILISSIMPLNMKTLKFLEQCFYGFRAVLKAQHIELEFTATTEKFDPIKQVLETLRGLEMLADKLKKTVVVFIDEFQRVLETERGGAIQGSIRSVAQTTKHIAFLFSGSSRHMLSKAFDDSNQPLYMMCEKIFLDRIEGHDYISYIQDAAKIKWAQELLSPITEHIIELSESHPFYVNYLCSKLWQEDRPPTSINDVDAGWQECLISEERRLVAELDKLTINQRLLLKEIAHTTNLKEPTAASFLTKIKMASGTAMPIIKALKNRDMIYVDKNGITKILDPLMRYLLVTG